MSTGILDKPKHISGRGPKGTGAKLQARVTFILTLSEACHVG